MKKVSRFVFIIKGEFVTFKIVSRPDNAALSRH